MRRGAGDDSRCPELEGAKLLLNKTEDGRPINQWAALNRILFLYKVGGLAVAEVCILLAIACITLANRSPVVVIDHGGRYTFVEGEERPVPLTSDNIKRFVESYIGLAFQWNSLDPEQITRNIAPLVTDDFRSQELAQLNTEKSKTFAGKSVKQSIAGLTVQITKSSTIATFDIVLRVDGVPLVVPTQVELELVQGDQTRWNPLGLYVNGETIHDGN